MKVVILAGGYGTRISEESQFVPKPMIKIGEMPIIWHIMKHYSCYGFHDFIICAGYKQEVIKEWFSNYFIHRNDVTFDFRENGETTIHHKNLEPWTVTVADTGLKTLTGGRIRAIREYLEDETFMLTYGDGVSDVNLNSLLAFHRKNGKLITLTAIQPGSRFGVLKFQEDRILSFQEKKMKDSDWVNIGYMVLEPETLDYIQGDYMLENEPMTELVKDEELVGYRHDGFWQCMDTLRDKLYLEKLWEEGNAPWKLWDK